MTFDLLQVHGQFFMSGKVLKTVYFLKGNKTHHSNLHTLGARTTKGNNSSGIHCPFFSI